MTDNWSLAFFHGGYNSVFNLNVEEHTWESAGKSYIHGALLHLNQGKSLALAIIASPYIPTLKSLFSFCESARAHQLPKNLAPISSPLSSPRLPFRHDAHDAFYGALGDICPISYLSPLVLSPHPLALSSCALPSQSCLSKYISQRGNINGQQVFRLPLH